MEHFRLRKYRGPETWRQVRTAYEAGEPGPSVARRFDVGLSNLRKKARLEGWDRRSLAEAADLKPVRGAPDDPAPAVGPLAATPACTEPDAAPDPMEAAIAARDEAARRAARGDGRGAMELIKAADALMDGLATLTALRCDMNRQDREELENERHRLAQDEEWRHAAERRRQFEREAELAEAEHQALLARLTLPPAPEAPLPPDPAEAPEPPASGAEPPALCGAGLSSRSSSGCGR